VYNKYGFTDNVSRVYLVADLGIDLCFIDLFN